MISLCSLPIHRFTIRLDVDMPCALVEVEMSGWDKKTWVGACYAIGGPIISPVRCYLHIVANGTEPLTLALQVAHRHVGTYRLGEKARTSPGEAIWVPHE